LALSRRVQEKSVPLKNQPNTKSQIPIARA
jgi:hypothetical protein